MVLCPSLQPYDGLPPWCSGSSVTCHSCVSTIIPLALPCGYLCTSAKPGRCTVTINHANLSGAFPWNTFVFSICQDSVWLPRPVSKTNCLTSLSVITQNVGAHKCPLLEEIANDWGFKVRFPWRPRVCPEKATMAKGPSFLGSCTPFLRSQ